MKTLDATSEPLRLLELALTGRPHAALLALQPHMHASQEDAGILRVYGVALGMTGRLEEGVSALQRALDLAPGDVWSQAYLGVQLHALGLDVGVADVFDHDALIVEGTLLPDEEPEEAKRLFHRELAEYISGHPTLTWDAPFKATTSGWQTDDLLDDDKPVMQRFKSLLMALIRQLLDDWRDDSPPAQGQGSADSALSLVGWGVVLKSGGVQQPHVHPVGVLSGVCYLQVPPLQGDAGALRFRRTLPWIASRSQSIGDLPRYVRPVPGKVVIFPSFFWHETVPFESPVERISVAFDVLPARP